MQFKKDWLCLPQFCPFYGTKPIHILQVLSAAFSSPDVTSRQLRHTDALTWQTITNSQCSLWKQQLFTVTWKHYFKSTNLYSRAPKHQRDITSAMCLPDHSARQQQGIRGSSLITKEQNLPVTEWEKQVNRTKRAICYTCASQKNAYMVLSELSALPCFLVQLNQSIPEASCYKTGAGKLNQTTPPSKRD